MMRILVSTLVAFFLAVPAQAQNLTQQEDNLIVQCHAVDRWAGQRSSEALAEIHVDLAEPDYSQTVKFWEDFLVGFGVDPAMFGAASDAAFAQLSPLLDSGFDRDRPESQLGVISTMSQCIDFRVAWLDDRCESVEPNPAPGLRLPLQNLELVKLCREVEASWVDSAATVSGLYAFDLSRVSHEDVNMSRLLKFDDMLARQAVPQCPDMGPNARFGGELSQRADTLVASDVDAFFAGSDALLAGEDEATQQAAMAEAEAKAAEYRQLTGVCDQILGLYGSWSAAQP